MLKEKIYFIDNDAIFYYFFKDNLYLFIPLIMHLFKINKKEITNIKLLNKNPYLDEVYNKYNVLYLQVKILNKYVYLIINNVNNNKSIKYSENYMLNIELMRKYKKVYQKNKGEIKNAYFIFSKEKWVERIMVWIDNGKIILTDFKYIFNSNNKNSYLLKNIRKVVEIISISNEYEFNKQENKFKKRYMETLNLIDNNILKEADILKIKRNNLILDSVINTYK